MQVAAASQELHFATAALAEVVEEDVASGPEVDLDFAAAALQLPVDFAPSICYTVASHWPTAWRGPQPLAYSGRSREDSFRWRTRTGTRQNGFSLALQGLL